MTQSPSETKAALKGSFGAVAPTIRVGDHSYVDPTHPGHDYLSDKPEGTFLAKLADRLGL